MDPRTTPTPPPGSIPEKPMPSYMALKEWLQRCPETWLPGLFIHITELSHKTFRNKAAQLKVAEHAIDRLGNEETKRECGDRKNDEWVE